jgi:hypothetical protein
MKEILQQARIEAMNSGISTGTQWIKTSGKTISSVFAGGWNETGRCRDR